MKKIIKKIIKKKLTFLQRKNIKISSVSTILVGL